MTVAADLIGFGLIHTDIKKFDQVVNGCGRKSLDIGDTFL